MASNEKLQTPGPEGHPDLWGGEGTFAEQAGGPVPTELQLPKGTVRGVLFPLTSRSAWLPLPEAGRA